MAKIRNNSANILMLPSKLFFGLGFILALTCINANGSALKTIQFGSESFEPFFSEDFKSGIFVELINEAFSRTDRYKVEYVRMARKRIASELTRGRVDAGFNIFKNSKITNVFISLPFFRWSDCVYYKKSKGIKIRSFKDFKGLSLVTYQNAKQYNGLKFSNMTRVLQSYKEHYQQDNIGKLLVKDRVDVAWQDLNTALNTLNSLKENVSAYEFVELQKSAYTYIGFKDEKVRDAFNSAAVSMMIDGTYEKIFQRYTNKFGLKSNSDNLIKLKM